MRSFLFSHGLLLAVFAATTLCVTGCGSDQKVADTHADHDHDKEKGETKEAGHDDHSGWWCNEHGVPEEVCTRCSSTLITEFKEKNDWCDEHSRPDSQCFHCHPELETKFASLYEAKNGKLPPKPTDP